MPFQPVGNGAEVVVKGQLLGESVVTTFPFLGTVDFNAGHIETLADVVKDAWELHCLPQLPGAYASREVVARGLRSPNDFEHTAPWVLGGTGLLTSAAMPNNVSICLTRKTAQRGRSYRGRIFWPGLVEQDVTDNRVNVGRADAILDAIRNFWADVSTFGVFAMAVITRWENNALRPVAIANPITSWSMTDTVVDSMRRRLPKRGT